MNFSEFYGLAYRVVALHRKLNGYCCALLCCLSAVPTQTGKKVTGVIGVIKLFCASSIYVMAIAVMPTVASASNLIYMLDMSVQLDEQDRQDFRGALKKASECTLARRFSCSEEQLREAARLANGKEDRLAFDSTRQYLQDKKQRAVEEAQAQAMAEQEQKLRLTEKRREEQNKAEVQAKMRKHEQTKVQAKVENNSKYLRGTLTAVSTLLGSVLNGPVQLMLMGFAVNGILDSNANEHKANSNLLIGENEREQNSRIQ